MIKTYSLVAFVGVSHTIPVSSILKVPLSPSLIPNIVENFEIFTQIASWSIENNEVKKIKYPSNENYRGYIGKIQRWTTAQKKNHLEVRGPLVLYSTPEPTPFEWSSLRPLDSHPILSWSSNVSSTREPNLLFTFFVESNSLFTFSSQYT